MSQSPSKKQLKHDSKLRGGGGILDKRGYSEATKIANTLQGTIWRALNKLSGESVVIKITSKALTSKSMIITNGIKHKVDENILMEKDILQYLTTDNKCPKYITKYVDFMKSNLNYYLIQTDGGHSLFDFNVKVHDYIESNKIDISEYHKLVKVLFLQMIEIIEYIHNKNVIHFDLSLENWLINDIDVFFNENNKLQFCYDQNDDEKSVISTLCDFGLAEKFDDDEKNDNKFVSSKLCGKLHYCSPEISNEYESFSAQKNDIWCLGICLFGLITGSFPFKSSNKNDLQFQIVMNNKDGLMKLMKEMNRTKYINNDLLQLFNMIFKYENDRADMNQIKNCKWLKDI